MHNDKTVGEVFIYFNQQALDNKRRILEKQGYETCEKWEDICFGPVGYLKVIGCKEKKK